MHLRDQNSDAHHEHSRHAESAAPPPVVDPSDPSDPGGHPAFASTPPFYWHLPKKERTSLDHLIVEDEGYLAHDIKWGRLMLDVRLRYVSVPDVSAAWVPPQTSEQFSDAVSAILQVAVEAGLDPEHVSAAALATQNAAREQAARSIRRG